ncbi:hypothetical protein X551_02775 [Methylibium sp. T29]|nr:hypothetical protein X551_02775 [Methylibium sp. T29]EWS58750.1 hypothetical protein Y694_03374 [Methylibium sp. T29-B]
MPISAVSVQGWMRCSAPTTWATSISANTAVRNSKVGCSATPVSAARSIIASRIRMKQPRQRPK